MLSYLRRISVFEKTTVAATLMFAAAEAILFNHFVVAFLLVNVAVLYTLTAIDLVIFADLGEEIGKLRKSRDTYKDLTHLVFNRASKREADR